MIRWRDGRVVEVGDRRPGAVEVLVEIRGESVSAVAFPAVVGEPQIGDRVLLNVGALEMGLGTGGFALVVAIPDRLPSDFDAPGHIVKARYTPLQVTVLGADEQDSPHHEVLRDADNLGGMPVVVADLHSALAPITAGIRDSHPQARVVYVMSDGGALPMWMSRTVSALREAEWLAGTVTVGQAFGGDVEAVTVHSGLLAARRVLDADIAVVTQGPGNLGTGTRWGFSGVASGEAVNAAGVLAGRPIAALRVSEVDPRPRHRGVSHHTLTALGRVALARSDVVLPVVPEPFGEVIRTACRPLAQRHRLVDVSVDGLADALATSPATLASMGRGFSEDPVYFLACAAAGRHAASVL